MRINLNSENRIAAIIPAVMLGLYITNVSSVLHGVTGINPANVSTVMKIMILLILLSNLGAFILRFNKIILVSLFATAAAYLLEILCFPQNYEFNNTFMTFIVNVLPAILTMAVIRDFSKLLRALLAVSIGISAANIIILLSGVMRSFDGSYSMGFAGAMILPTIVLFEKVSRGGASIKFNIILCILAIGNMAAVVLYGSRGAFVAMLLFVAYVIIRKVIAEKNFKAFIPLVILLVIVFSYQSIVRFFYQMSLNYGFQSRTLNLFVNEIAHDSNRIELWQTVLGEIAKNPFAIRGINADFLLVGSYSHNYFIELIYEFGVLIGGIMSVYIVTQIIRCIVSIGGGRERKPCRQSQCNLSLFFFPCMPVERISLDQHYVLGVDSGNDSIFKCPCAVISPQEIRGARYA